MVHWDSIPHIPHSGLDYGSVTSILPPNSTCKTLTQRGSRIIKKNIIKLHATPEHVGKLLSISCHRRTRDCTLPIGRYHMASYSVAIAIGNRSIPRKIVRQIYHRKIVVGVCSWPIRWAFSIICWSQPRKHMILYYNTGNNKFQREKNHGREQCIPSPTM